MESTDIRMKEKKNYAGEKNEINFFVLSCIQDSLYYVNFLPAAGAIIICLFNHFQYGIHYFGITWMSTVFVLQIWKMI